MCLLLLVFDVFYITKCHSYSLGTNLIIVPVLCVFDLFGLIVV